jgi:hypothetical protein
MWGGAIFGEKELQSTLLLASIQATGQTGKFKVVTLLTLVF